MTDLQNLIALVLGPLALVASAAALVVILLSALLANVWDRWVGK